MTSLFGLILVSVSVAQPFLATAAQISTPPSWIPAVAAQSTLGEQPAAAVQIAAARDMRHVAPSAHGVSAVPSDPAEYPNLAVAAQSLQRQALEYRSPRAVLPPLSSLYPQNAITLWDRIRDSTVQDRRAFLLGTAIQMHAPLIAASSGEWRGEGRHPGGATPPQTAHAPPPPA